MAGILMMAMKGSGIIIFMATVAVWLKKVPSYLGKKTHKWRQPPGEMGRSTKNKEAIFLTNRRNHHGE
eukprot:14469629-Heterocapsa_arctica.AAC.1